MRQAFIIEQSDEAKVGVSTIENSNKVRVTVLEGKGDSQVELSLKDAKEVRKALDKAITLAENPYIVGGTISAGSILGDYLYRSYPSYGFSRYGL